MRVLRVGARGDDVLAWETFLCGLDFYLDEVDGVFNDATRTATAAFQRKNNLSDDGIVGMETYAVAAGQGFTLLVDDSSEEGGPNWPSKPVNLKPLVTNEDKARVFGKFSFKPAPIVGSQENISITDGWARDNIVHVEIPQLRGVDYAPTKVAVHRLVAEPIKNLFLAWELGELLHLVKTWGGSWAPRFIRGSRTTLSNHAFGSAFDINVPWNGLGKQPALVGQIGSVRKLVPIANSLGFYWGGHFTRQDGMHFEFVG